MFTWYLVIAGVLLWLFATKASSSVKKVVHFGFYVVLGYAVVFHLKDVVGLLSNIANSLWPWMLKSANHFAQSGANLLNSK